MFRPAPRTESPPQCRLLCFQPHRQYMRSFHSIGHLHSLHPLVQHGCKIERTVPRDPPPFCCCAPSLSTLTFTAQLQTFCPSNILGVSGIIDMTLYHSWTSNTLATQHEEKYSFFSRHENKANRRETVIHASGRVSHVPLQ